MHVKEWKARGKHSRFFDLPKFALILIILFLVGILPYCHFLATSLLLFYSRNIDRTIYFLITPFGAVAEKPGLVTVFADLPALIFLTVFSITVIRWAEIYHVSIPLIVQFLINLLVVRMFFFSFSRTVSGNAVYILIVNRFDSFLV
jgi:hypothetical protein